MKTINRSVDRYNVDLDVELIQEYTAEHPGEIQMTMINEADQVREFEYGPSPLSHGEHDSVDAYLHAEYSGNTYDEPENGCWRSLNHLGGEPELTGATLDPGESVSESYELLAAADEEYCLPGGLYWFESTLFVNGEDGDADEVALEWAACLE